MNAENFERRVARFIADNALPEPGSRLIVGLSGGADSTALAAVLCALGYEVIAAHCNFRLRGEESMRDCRHAQCVAARLGIDIHLRDFDVPARMAQSGESVEMACRTLRYDWFLHLLERHRARAVTVGHHREDNAETLMLNLLRGTGIAGLGGMRPRRDYVVRPLLEMSRADIEGYLRERGFDWVDDSSNFSDVYRRNALRLNTLPALETAHPGAMDAIVRTARNVAASKALYDIAVARMASAFVSNAANGDTRLDVGAICRELGEHPGSPATTLIFETLRPYGFAADTATSIVRAFACGNTGLRFLSPTHLASYDRGILTLTPALANTARDNEIEVSLRRDILAPLHIVVSEHDIAEFAPRHGDRNTLYLDSRVLDGEPRFTLRHWRRGDRIRPFGMGGRSKLVSDIFTNARLGLIEKERLWLLCRDEEILWIAGLRASEAFAVTPDTRRYLELNLDTGCKRQASTFLDELE